MSKTKLIALCGVCGAVALICLIFLSYAKWVALALSVIASVVVCCPQLIDGKYVWYSIATCLTTVILASLLANVVYIAPVALYAMPCCICKIACNSKSAPAFKAVKWLCYVAFAVLALVVTGVLIWWLAPNTWQALVQNSNYWWLAIVVVLVSIVAYDKLLDGAIFVVKKALDKSKFSQ